MPSYESNDYLTYISSCVNDYINKRSLTIINMAELCGLSYNEMRNIVNNTMHDIKLSTLLQIADCMDVSPTYLIHIEHPTTKEDILLKDFYIKLKSYFEYR